MDQLIRETQPPAGTLRSPVPQYWNPDTEKYERVLGVHGAPRAMLYGPNGQPISTSNRLPVDVGAQVATESTLAEAVSRLNAILTRLEGTLDVDVGGQIHADVDLGDVTVQIGEVQQGKRGQNAEPWEVTLSGSDGKPLKGVGLSKEVRAGLPNRQAPAAGATTTLLEVTVPCILEWWYWIIHENADADMSLGVYRRTSTGGRVAYFYGLVDDHSGVTRTEIYRMSQLVDRAAALGVSPVQGLRGGRRAILFKGPLECPYGFTIDVTRVAEPSGDGYMWFTCNYREV